MGSCNREQSLPSTPGGDHSEEGEGGDGGSRDGRANAATACCWTAGFMQLALMDYSFEAFEVTDPVSEALCLSCDKAVVKPMGWFSIGAMCVGTVALVLFNQAGSARVAKMAGGGAAAMI